MPRQVYTAGGHADHRLDALLSAATFGVNDLKSVMDLDPNSRILWRVEGIDVDAITTDPVELVSLRKRWPFATVTVTPIAG